MRGYENIPFLGKKMALINNIYVLVENEEYSGEVNTTSHPTESGMPITDTIRKEPISISLNGKIANTNNLTAKETIDKIEALKNSGSLIKYVGRCGTKINLQIKSFTHNYSNKNFGGADFDMTLKELKIAKTAYVTNNATVKTSSKPKEGDYVVFLGGYVYVSSDAKTPSAKRLKGSKCKLTKISTLAGAKHIYHLISTDCKYGSNKYVYGWVDDDKVQDILAYVANQSNGGTQQVSEEERDVIYHTVKSGETIWGLVNKTYKSKKLSVSKVIEDNPQAFSRKDDPTSLQIGARLKLTVRG